MDGPGLGPTTPHYALYIDLFIKPKSMKIPFSIHPFALLFFSSSKCGRKKYTCICSKQKALVLTKCLLVLS